MIQEGETSQHENNVLKQKQKHDIRIVHSLMVSLAEINMTSESPTKRSNVMDY